MLQQAVGRTLWEQSATQAPALHTHNEGTNDSTSEDACAYPEENPSFWAALNIECWCCRTCHTSSHSDNSIFLQGTQSAKSIRQLQCRPRPHKWPPRPPHRPPWRQSLPPQCHRQPQHLQQPEPQQLLPGLDLDCTGSEKWVSSMDVCTAFLWTDSCPKI